MHSAAIAPTMVSRRATPVPWLKEIVCYLSTVLICLTIVGIGFSSDSAAYAPVSNGINMTNPTSKPRSVRLSQRLSGNQFSLTPPPVIFSAELAHIDGLLLFHFELNREPILQHVLNREEERMGLLQLQHRCHHSRTITDFLDHSAPATSSSPCP